MEQNKSEHLEELEEKAKLHEETIVQQQKRLEKLAASPTINQTLEDFLPQNIEATVKSETIPDDWEDLDLDRSDMQIEDSVKVEENETKHLDSDGIPLLGKRRASKEVMDDVSVDQDHKGDKVQNVVTPLKRTRASTEPEPNQLDLPTIDQTIPTQPEVPVTENERKEGEGV